MSALTSKNYAVITLSYWVLMLTDGAIRMLVLLHFYQLGYTAEKLAFLFLLYEFSGILVNLFGGFVGAKYGLKILLFSGLLLQIIATVLLSLVSPYWSVITATGYVMLVQCLAGAAKDATKISAKSAAKSSTLDDKQGTLFRLVAWLTGSKNAVKGIGYFVGGLLLSYLGFQLGLWLLATLVLSVFILALIVVRNNYGKMQKPPSYKHLFAKSKAVNCLSFARSFLFASRDVWFVVALPLFLSKKLQWSFTEIGGFMAIWIIIYGFFQAVAPRFTIKSNTNNHHTVNLVIRKLLQFSWCLLIICCLLLGCYLFAIEYRLIAYFIPIVLIVFGLFFAFNSSIHSYLILAYTTKDDMALNMGFYYMSNAVGRFVGTLLSGVSYLYGGFLASLCCACIFTMVTIMLHYFLPRQHTIVK